MVKTSNNGQNLCAEPVTIASFWIPIEQLQRSVCSSVSFYRKVLKHWGSCDRIHRNADVMELVDMQDLGSCAERRAGSSPAIRTMTNKKVTPKTKTILSKCVSTYYISCLCRMNGIFVNLCNQDGQV